MLRFPTRYAVYDLETTGLDPDHDEAIEIGLILVDDGKVVAEHSWLIKPPRPIDAKIEEITGITQKMLDEEGRPPEECWPEFLDRMSNYTPVGHNITKFDNLFIDRALYKHVKAYRVQAFPWVDTAALYKGRLLGEDQLWKETHMEYAKRILEIRAYGVHYKLVQIYQDLGGSMEGIDAHRALSDCRMTNYVYRKMCLEPVVTMGQQSIL